ncbi:hypothetical protein MKX03_015439 [Papaver bracteatum]|nr:hypothetical protein MKX03_015439 [Papaver bracteatum]
MDINPTTPEKPRVNRMKHKGMILERKNKKICQLLEITDAEVPGKPSCEPEQAWVNRQRRKSIVMERKCKIYFR